MFTLSIQNLIQTKIEGNLIKLNFCLLDFFFKSTCTSNSSNFPPRESSNAFVIADDIARCASRVVHLHRSCVSLVHVGYEKPRPRPTLCQTGAGSFSIRGCHAENEAIS